MSCNPSKILTLTVCLAIFATGCSPSKPLYFGDSGDLSHYVDQATKIEYPDVEYPTLDEVTQSYEPMTVIDPDFTSFEDMTLEDAVSYALSNSKVIRGYGTPTLLATRVSPGQDSLANGPSVAATTYDISIRESEPGFLSSGGALPSPSALSTNTGLDINQGVESALAAFDAQLTSSLTYTKSNEPRNGSSIFDNTTFEQDQVTWQSEVSKRAANGTQIFFRNINQYTENNNPLTTDDPAGAQVLDSFYRTSLEAEVRQPLLRGRGTFINRLPIVISRIGTDQELAILETTLQNMVTNVEIRYWDLYCNYRTFESAKTGRDAALETWRIVKDQFDEGAEVNIQQVAQASEQYHFFDAQVIDAYNNLLNTEGQLRFLLGWSSTDGRFIRPIDEPVMAPVEFDWCNSLCEALTYRAELRQERWEVKRRELALAFSKNGLLPELNATLLYRWLGLGDQFGSSGGADFPDAGSGALNQLYGGDFQELQVGGTFAMPVGFRRELANVRNAQLRLARELARVEDMELDIQKELAEAMRALAANLMIMQSSFNRWKDTTIEEEHFERLQDAGVETLDVALDAQRRRSQAEVAFYTALCEYNKVIALIHRRKGTILPYCGVHFSEGPWPGKAYLDAEEHARRRGASRELNYGWSRPGVISRGENWPSGSNTGNTPSGHSIPATQSVGGNQVAPIIDQFHEAPIDGGQYLDGGPVYDAPFIQAPATPRGIPTPALRGSSSRNRIDSSVRPASHVEEVPVKSTIPNDQSQHQVSQINSDVTPVAVLKKTSAKSMQKRTRQSESQTYTKREGLPERDTSPVPAKRLKAATPLRSAKRQGSEASGDSSRSTGVLRTGHLSWEKLGLERPEQNLGRTTARIKTN